MKSRMESKMSSPVVIGVDIGKDVFHLVGFAADGKIAFRRRIKRLALKDVFEEHRSTGKVSYEKWKFRSRRRAHHWSLPRLVRSHRAGCAVSIASRGTLRVDAAPRSLSPDDQHRPA